MASLEAWCSTIRTARLKAVERNALIALADLLRSEMESANKHYADGNFDPDNTPFIEVEETVRGACAMIQYNTERRNIVGFCETFQKQLRSWIDEIAVGFGFSLPLRFEP